MAVQPPSLKSLPIDWQFSISEQGFTTRYGKLGTDLYKQYLPFGIVDEIAHPPKKVELRVYNLALLKAKQRNPQSLP